VVEVDDVRVHRFDQRRQGGEAVGVGLGQGEAVEMAEPDEHLVRGAVAHGLQQGARPAGAVCAGDGGEEQALHAVAVAELAEQAARQHLRAAGLEVGVVVAEVEDAHRGQAASSKCAPEKRSISAPMAGAQRAWWRKRL
jgi:hypothetical protein